MTITKCAGLDMEQLSDELRRIESQIVSRIGLSLHSSSDRRAASKKVALVLQAHVLLAMLSREDGELHAAAVRAVHDCWREKKRLGRALRSVAGERRWAQAARCTRLILVSKKR